MQLELLKINYTMQLMTRKNENYVNVYLYFLHVITYFLVCHVLHKQFSKSVFRHTHNYNIFITHNHKLCVLKASYLLFLCAMKLQCCTCYLKNINKTTPFIIVSFCNKYHSIPPRIYESTTENSWL